MLRIGILIDGQNAQTWKIDYTKLTPCIEKLYDKFNPFINIKRIYVTVEERMDNMKYDFWHVMMMQGFEVVKREYQQGQKVDVDAHIGSELRKYAYHCDVIVLISGDGDYLPVMEDIVGEGLAHFLIISERSCMSTDFKSYSNIPGSPINVLPLDYFDLLRK